MGLGIKSGKSVSEVEMKNKITRKTGARPLGRELPKASNRRGTPKMFASAKFWGRRLAGPVFLVLLIAYANINYASALTYSSHVDLEYNVNTTLDVAFSSNTGFIISDLAPGNAAYSNVVTITASSNNSDGFIMSATVGKDSNVDSYRNNNSLVYVNNNTSYAFESIATNADLTLSELGDDGNGGSANQWGYAICNETTVDTNTNLPVCSTWSSYSGLPAVGNTGKVILSTDTSGSASLDMKIGASSTNTQVSGTFTNDINFLATARVVAYDYTVTYNANNPSSIDNVTNMPTNITASNHASLNTGDVLSASSIVPVLTDYVFAGWCDGVVAGNVCGGRLVQPGEYLKIDNPVASDGSTVNNIVLTAVWRIYMQDQTPTTLATLLPNIGDTITLYDKRDDKSYTVGRLKMNTAGTTSAYWMLENLALDITAVDYATLTGNTNASDTTLEYLKGIKSRDVANDPTGNYPTGAVSKAWTSSSQNYFDKPMIAVDSATSGTCGDAYCVNDPSNGQWSYDSTTSKIINNTTSIVQGKIGVYYNYCAASAGLYCYGSGTSHTGSPATDPNTSSIRDVEEDICPKGWRLPTSTNDGEFNTLYTAYGSNYTAFETALSTPLSGYFYSGKAYGQGDRGYFWSSTWNCINCMHYLVVRSSSVGPSDYGNRSLGNAVRCILAE